MSKDTVQDGLVVSMDYKLTVDGEVLDSSEDAGPLQFLAGYGNIVPGLEREMAGMKIGESKDVVVLAKTVSCIISPIAILGALFQQVSLK